MDKTAALASDILLGIGGEKKYSASGKLHDACTRRGVQRRKSLI